MSRFCRLSFLLVLLMVCTMAPLAGRAQSASAPNAPAPNAPTAVNPAPASAPAAPSAPGTPNPAEPSGNIHLNIVVTDHAGKPVSGLTASDFSLLDNGQPSKILSFAGYDEAAKPEHPVQVVILFDTVNTDFNTVSYTRQQVSNYLRRNGGHLAHPVTLAWITNTNVEPQGPPTLDGNALANALDAATGRLRTISAAAGAYGAIERMELSSKLLDTLARVDFKIPGRKLMIWAGPGWPMLDGPNINISPKGQQAIFGEIVELSTLLREAQIGLYSVSQGMPGPDTFLYESFLKGVKKTTQAQIPNLGLKVVAVQSGGLALAPTNDVSSSIDTCIREAATYYSVSFAPPRADGPTGRTNTTNSKCVWISLDSSRAPTPATTTSPPAADRACCCGVAPGRHQ